PWRPARWPRSRPPRGAGTGEEEVSTGPFGRKNTDISRGGPMSESETSRKARRGEQPMVPPAEFTSYYGKPVLNAPVWEPRDIAGYLFLGGLAGTSSLLGAGAQLTGRPSLARAAKTGAFGAGCLSMAALVHDRSEEHTSELQSL